MINQLVSSCCQSVLVAHISDEGTGYYTCSKCGEACNQSFSRRQEHVSDIDADYSYIDKIIKEKGAEQAAWIDENVKKLLSPWQIFIIKSSNMPMIIKKIIARSLNIDIIHQELIANFGVEIIVLKNGVIKARRKFSI